MIILQTGANTFLLSGLVFSLVMLTIGLVYLLTLELRKNSIVVVIPLLVASGVIFGVTQVFAVLTSVPIIIVSVSVTILAWQIVSEMVRFEVEI